MKLAWCFILSAQRLEQIQLIRLRGILRKAHLALANQADEIGHAARFSALLQALNNPIEQHPAIGAVLLGPVKRAAGEPKVPHQ